MKNIIGRADGIIAFVKGQPHPNPAILDNLNADLELQMNVHPLDGEKTVKDGKTWYTDTCGHTWGEIRVDSEDRAAKPLHFDPKKYASRVGTTGWDWKAKQSRFFGFDFDALTGHAKGVGIDDRQLDKIKNAASNLPYVEVRKSTKAKGIHLYVYVNGIDTGNHTEHAAVARCVLGMISTDIEFDLTPNVDACGGNMWFWSSEMVPESFQIIHKATKTLTATDLPANWKDYIEVVKRQRSKVRVNGVSTAEEDDFDSLTTQNTIVPLDANHKKDIDALRESGFSAIWFSDYHMMQTHTCALAKNTRVGLFQTNSPGNDPGSPNCFMFPLHGGGWRVFRFSPGITETPSWSQAPEKWTQCVWNQHLDLAAATLAVGGAENADKGEFHLASVVEAEKAAQAMGFSLGLTEEKYSNREDLRMKKMKDGRINVYVPFKDDDNLRGWCLDKKGKCWSRAFVSRIDEKEEIREAHSEADKMVRAISSPQGKHQSYAINGKHGWERSSAGNTKLFLQSEGMTKAEAEAAMGTAVGNHWKNVNIPFQPNFLSDRRWNMDAAQYRVQPTTTTTGKPVHPHWDMVHAHIGSGLDEAVKANQWCKDNNILDGKTYILYWIACVLRKPFTPSPYLGLFGDENSGKSIFHESLNFCLLTKGVVAAKLALTNSSGFNGELATAIIAVVEESDLSASEEARDRLKLWVTAIDLQIREMYSPPYTVPSTLHFVQIANHRSKIPVYPNDSRVVFCRVQMPENPMDKDELMDALTAEAPQFLETILNLPLPSTLSGRMSLAVVETADKVAQGLENAPALLFFQEECVLDAAAEIGRSVLYQAYASEAKSNGERPVSQKIFCQQLRAFGNGTIDTEKRSRITLTMMNECGEKITRRVPSFVGIRLKTQEEHNATN